MKRQIGRIILYYSVGSCATLWVLGLRTNHPTICRIIWFDMTSGQIKQMHTTDQPCRAFEVAVQRFRGYIKASTTFSLSLLFLFLPGRVY